jgi:hypothetical protein
MGARLCKAGIFMTENSGGISDGITKKIAQLIRLSLKSPLPLPKKI